MLFLKADFTLVQNQKHLPYFQILLEKKLETITLYEHIGSFPPRSIPSPARAIRPPPPAARRPQPPAHRLPPPDAGPPPAAPRRRARSRHGPQYGRAEHVAMRLRAMGGAGGDATPSNGQGR